MPTKKASKKKSGSTQPVSNDPGFRRTIAVNRKAMRDYELLERLEVGLVLTGTEIKSIRKGRVNLRDSFARRRGGEIWLFNAHIASFEEGNRYNHDPYRWRKLLLHKKQIHDFIGRAEQRSLTLVPIDLYLRNGKAKMTLALARGRKNYDKRQVIAQRDAQRQIQRSLKTALISRKPS